MVCLPPSGAGRSFFARWPRRVGGARLLPLSRPGHEERMRSPFAGSLREAASDVVAQVRLREPAAVVLVGHSLGATVAFEAARLLPETVALVVSARQAPHLPSRAPAGGDLVEAVRSWGGYGEEPDEAVTALTIPALRADLALSVAYRWDGGRTGVSVTAVSYDGDVVVDEESVRQWEAATTGPFRAVHLPGHHFTAREAPGPLIAVLSEAGRAGDR